MQINFRQGIVRAPNNFLVPNGDNISLNISAPDSVAVTFADGDANYLVTERFAVADAWVGPFTVDTWLYWDIDKRTGVRTFGSTLLEPVEGATAPTTPANDQHWFDTNSNKMKVWNAIATRWVERVRVFAAALQGGSVVTSVSVNAPLFTGTQVGALANIPVSAGALVFDTNGDPLKRGNGTFFTTEDKVTTGISTSTQVKLNSITLEAVAVQTIPAFTVVRFTGFGRIGIASSVSNRGVYGIVEADAPAGDLALVTTEGLVTNPEWNWSTAGINAPLYVDGSGNLTPTESPEGVAVATVVDQNTVLIRPTVLTITGEGSGGGGQPTTPNTAYGLDAFAANVSGEENTAIGYKSQGVATDGYGNTSVGAYSMLALTTGVNNVAVGISALESITDGSRNTAVGASSMILTTTGTNNVAIGVSALENCGEAHRNIAVGSNAMVGVMGVTGSDNIAIGTECLMFVTSGSANIAVGSNALASETTGSDNIVLGSQSLMFSANAGSNIVVGNRSMVGLETVPITGTGNVVIGTMAYEYPGQGTNNTAMGTEALRQGGWANLNTVIGYRAGYNVTGNGNTYLGTFTGYRADPGLDYNIAAASNHIVLSDGDANPRLIIDNNGNHIQTVTDTAPTLPFNQTMTFELTSDTSLRVVVRGSDGVTRSTTLTLA